MPVRYGLKTTLRARGRSILFALLIFVLTLVLALGAGMWGACSRLLARMDETYTCIALMEAYQGEDYPDPNAADEAAREAFAALPEISGGIAALPGVQLWEPADEGAVMLEGYGRSQGEMPYRSSGVVVASGLSPLYNGFQMAIKEENLPQGFEEQIAAIEELAEGYKLADIAISYNPNTHSFTLTGQQLAGYTGRIERSVYTREGKDNVFVIFDFSALDSTPFAFDGAALEQGQKYLVHGEFVSGNSSNRTFAVREFIRGGASPWQLLSGADDPALTGGVFAETAEFYRLTNSAVRVAASDDPASLLAFQQGALYLTEGRFPMPGEQGACVLSGSTAQQMDAKVGDTVTVQLLDIAPESRWALSETGKTRQWLVVGITALEADYEGWIWVSAAEGGFGQPLFGFTLGRAVLENRQAVAAVERMQALQPGGARLTLYDQGYTAAARPIEMMRTAAMTVTLACGCAALAVLLLFALLFVGRQRETVEVLNALGTPKGWVRLWLLAGAGCIAGVSALLGALAGALALGRTAALALEAAANLYAVDTRYSDAAVGILRDAPAGLAAPWWTAPAAGLAVLGCAMLFCFAFLQEALREEEPRRGGLAKKAHIPKGKTSTAGRGAVRFAFLSAVRGGRRSLAVPATALALTLLLGILAGSGQDADAQLNALYEDSVLEGAVVTGNGRGYTRYTGLTVPMDKIQLLSRSGMLGGAPSVSLSWHYWLDGSMPDFGYDTFGWESRLAWIRKQPDLVACNDLAAAPAFYHADMPGITWLEGYDADILHSGENVSFLAGTDLGSKGTPVGGEEPLPVYPALASHAFLQEQGLALGDELPVNYLFPASYRYDPRYMAEMNMMFRVDVQIVGEIAGTGKELYLPLSFWCGEEWLRDEKALAPENGRMDGSIHNEEERDRWFYSQRNFDTCRFALRSAAELEPFRAYLAKNEFSQLGALGRNRTTLLLWDQAFTETAGALGRYAGFSQMLTPALLAAVGVLGFLLSWLMVHGRRMEFAVLRGLGAPRGRVFGSFFWEQALLCLPGCLAGACLLAPFFPAWAVLRAAGGFLLCYLAGCALSVALIGRVALMELLAEREG